MRLTPAEITAIKTAAREVFGPTAVVRLFGSRVRDDLQGGDIDLHVEVDAGRQGIFNEFACRRQITDRIGDQKIDILVTTRGTKLQSPVERIAYEDGLVL